MSKEKVLILGKLPPPFMGPAIATEIILNSRLNEEYELIHLNTGINADINRMGKFSIKKIWLILNLYRNYRRMLKEHKPGLILVPISQTTAGFLKDAYFIKKGNASGAKVLIHLRGSDFLNRLKRSPASIVQKVGNVLKKAEGVIVLGNNLKYLFAEYFPENKIYVVPNGGNFTFPQRKSKETTVRYIANYLPGKGLEDILEAIVILQSKGIGNFQFMAHGSWDNEEYRQKCEKIKSDNNLQNVYLNASVSGKEKWEALADSDVFIFTPRNPEGHPWSLVEATAASLPIISTDQGAIKETVLEGKNGFLVPHSSPMEIAEKLKLLLQNQSLRKNMGLRSRNIYLEHFTEANMVENLSQTFKSVLSN